MRTRLALAIAVVLSLAVVLGPTRAARAEPLSLEQIPADAKWAAHLDVDALRASSLPQKARQQILANHPEAEKHLAMACDVWNFDPRTDLHGITIYGSQIKRDTGVAIVNAKVDQKLLAEKVQQAPNYQATKYGKYELHSWTHAKGSSRERAMTGTLYKPDVLVFGASADEVKAALDVLDGTKPNFVSHASESGLSLSIPTGTILVAGVTGLADVVLPCKSPLTKQADSIVLAIGESQGNAFVVGQIAAKKTEIAQQIKTVVDGALALATLANADDADAIKIVNAVNVSVSDKTVNMECRAPVDVVWAHTQKAIAEAKEAHKQWNAHGIPGQDPAGK
jgi:hypothetical protein